MERIVAEGARPERWALVLHGIFGSAANFRSLARRVAREAPGWGFVLADLRGHARAPRAEPPHTVEAAAADLEGVASGIHAVLGHSFGGKVALAYAERHPEVDRIFLLDSQPGPSVPDEGPGSSTAVLRLLESLPLTFPDRASFVRAVEGDVGPRVAALLAMSLVAGAGGYRLGFDLAAIRSMLGDYFARDSWPVVEDPRRKGRVWAVVGGRSQVLSAEDLARLARVGRVDVVPEAGHWVHVDDPDGVAQAIRTGLAGI